MTALLSENSYVRTKTKLAELERRLAALERRTDLSAVHKAEACRSCRSMIQEYRREIELFEATHRPTAVSPSSKS